MNWKNRDINVAEQASIPKFSKLDDIGIPLRLFELFFDDALVELFFDDVDMIVVYTKLVIKRNQILILKLLMKRFAYLRHASVAVLSFQTVRCTGRQPPPTPRYFCTSNIVSRVVISPLLPLHPSKSHKYYSYDKVPHIVPS